ncbi:cell division transport system ATP-binding protein [Thermostichus sp. OS-CIW-21]
MMIGQHIGYPPRLHRWAGTAPTPHPPAPAHPEATLGFYSSTQSGSLETPASMVSLRGVSKVFPNGNLIFQDVNLEVRRGEFVFVTGVSGAGKSTLLRLLYGAEQATEGTVIVDQVCLFSSEGRRRPYRIPPRPLAMLRRRLGVVFQDYRLLANRTLAENVAFVLRAQGLSPAEIRRRIGPTLKMVGLTEKRDHFPHELSGGEQQRLSLARAIVNMPVLLLADEPTGNLDPENSLLVLQILERLNSFGVTVIMTSHDPYLVERAGHRVVRMEGGRLYDLR